MNILIIDDSQTARMFTRKSFDMALSDLEETTFFEAANGEDAIKIMKSIKFDLVLSDVNMPVMSGFTFIQNILRDELLKDIPVIFITSLASEARKENLLEIGAKEVISKPIKPMDLATAVKKVLGLENSSATESDDTAGWG